MLKAGLSSEKCVYRILDLVPENRMLMSVFFSSQRALKVRRSHRGASLMIFRWMRKGSCIDAEKIM